MRCSFSVLLLSGRGFVSEDEYLEITGITRDQSGEYECSAVNDVAAPDIRKVKVTVNCKYSKAHRDLLYDCPALTPDAGSLHWAGSSRLHPPVISGVGAIRSVFIIPSPWPGGGVQDACLPVVLQLCQDIWGLIFCCSGEGAIIANPSPEWSCKHIDRKEMTAIL